MATDIEHLLRAVQSIAPNVEALAPILTRHEDRWVLATVAVVTSKVSGRGEMYTLAGALKITLSGEIVAHYDVGQAMIEVRPADRNVPRSYVERTRRRDRLYKALDPLLKQPSQSGMAALAEHYAGLLPAEVYPIYWELAPESRAWLTLSESVPPIEAAQRLDGVDGSNAPAASPQIDASLNTQQILTWIAEARRLAEACRLSKIAHHLDTLDAKMRQPAFSIAFLGEFKRGKSSLINRLLGENILPTSPLATAPVVTSVSSGERASMEVTLPDGEVQTRPVNPVAWNDLVAGQKSEGVTTVRLKLPNTWLINAALELIDTPGIGDLNGVSAGQVFDILGRCDVAAVIVSATSPFSLTEAAFVQHELVGRHVPRIVIIVTNLDRLEAHERQTVFDVASDRVRQTLPNATILPSYPLDARQTPDDTLEALREWFGGLAASSERAQLRERQVRRQLIAQLENIRTSGEPSAMLAPDIRPADTAELAMTRDQLRAGLEARRVERDRLFEQQVMKTDILRTLGKEWKRAGASEAWLNDGLVISLYRYLAELGVNLNQTIVDSAVEDFAWLEGEVFQKSADDPISSYPLTLKLGQSADMVMSYLSSGPAAVAAGLGTRVLGKAVVRGIKLTYGEQETGALIKEAVHVALTEYARQVAGRRETLYRQLFAETWEEGLAWHEAQTAAPTPAHQSAVERAEQLEQEIVG